jgi:Phage integrase, N-terminal SAM-like domain
MAIDYEHNHLSLVVINNACHNVEIIQRIKEAVSGLNSYYFTLIAERMSVNNANTIAQFVISNRKERNIAKNTVMIYIDGIVYLENYHKHKDLDKMDKNDIISFLDSYRKPESIDPLHKWINTYNIRLGTICRFFKWL